MAELFGIDPEVDRLVAAHTETEPLFRVKRKFVQRRAMLKIKADEAAKLDGPALEAELAARLGGRFEELAFSRAVLEWQADEAASAEALSLAERYCAWCAYGGGPQAQPRRRALQAAEEGRPAGPRTRRHRQLRRLRDPHAAPCPPPRGLRPHRSGHEPRARAVIRDEEWLIRRVDPSTDGGWLLSCEGISDLVRGQNFLFLTELEDAIEVLDPARTELIPDTSPTYNATILYLESLRRRSVADDQHIHLGHRGVMNLVSYQLDPALQALKQPRSRILIADAVGLGKTLEAGILATELIQRGRGKRILVVTQKAMLTQFQKNGGADSRFRW